MCIRDRDEVAHDADLAGRDADIIQMCFGFHVSLSSLLTGLGARMAAEGAGGGKLAQLMAHHILCLLYTSCSTAGKGYGWMRTMQGGFP